MLKWVGIFISTLIMACSPAPQSVQTRLEKLADFPKISHDFESYQQQVAVYLTNNKLANRSVEDVSLNMPFDLQANKTVAYQGRFLLFHGLNDSPYVWHDFAKEMVAKGFDVRAVLLEGHGSHPRNMLNVTAKQWIDSAKAHYDIWSHEQQAPLYLGGFSMGAVLATSLALDHPEVKGLFLVSPAFHSQLNNVLSLSWLYSQFKPWLFGQMLNEDNPFKYNSIAINSAAAYYKVTLYLKAKWANQTLKIPVLMVHSINDSVVDVSYSRGLFATKIQHHKKQLLLYSADITKEQVKPDQILRNSDYRQLRILNQSHLSLINHLDNPILGKEGTLLVCNGNEYAIFSACLRAKEHWYGAQHSISPDGVAVARTTYNPDFDYLVTLFSQMFVADKSD
jgi:esterase/lipase